MSSGTDSQSVLVTKVIRDSLVLFPGKTNDHTCYGLGLFNLYFNTYDALLFMFSLCVMILFDNLKFILKVLMSLTHILSPNAYHGLLMFSLLCVTKLWTT